MKKFITLILVLLLGFVVLNYDDNKYTDKTEDKNKIETQIIDKDGYYISKDDVALYIHTYNQLPNNFIKKKEASQLGWKSSEANLWDVTDKNSIGGDKFQNREKILPNKAGRQYYEADIDYGGNYRNAKRIVFSNDGLIYYTNDHYETFSLLYGDE